MSEFFEYKTSFPNFGKCEVRESFEELGVDLDLEGNHLGRVVIACSAGMRGSLKLSAAKSSSCLRMNNDQCRCRHYEIRLSDNVWM